MANHVKSVEYGNPDGKTVIYFHGAPGSPEEGSIFEKYAQEYDLNVICFDRFSVDSSLQGEDYYKFLAHAILNKSHGDPVDLIGFSIGCQAAIKTSIHLGTNVRCLHLISSAAPLDAGDFLDDMAGKTVFSMAIKQPTIFAFISYWQGFIAKVAPNTLFNILFSTAVKEDKILAKNNEFKKIIMPVLTQCFSSNLSGYIREIKHYVEPWEESVFKCNSNTYLWHGLNDNWSPVSMAEYLKKSLPAFSSLEVMKGLSHYSCLYKAAPKICLQLAKT